MVRESISETIQQIISTPMALWCFSIFTSLIVTLIGGWPQLLSVLAAAIVLDYTTGIIRAGFEGKLDSEIGYKGLVKKVCFLVMVMVGHFADMLFFQGQTDFFRDIIIALLLANEIISLMENLGSLGVPIPKKMKQFIVIFKEERE